VEGTPLTNLGQNKQKEKNPTPRLKKNILKHSAIKKDFDFEILKYGISIVDQ
jgi:hypothetical protein